MRYRACARRLHPLHAGRVLITGGNYVSSTVYIPPFGLHTCNKHLKCLTHKRHSVCPLRCENRGGWWRRRVRGCRGCRAVLGGVGGRRYQRLTRHTIRIAAAKCIPQPATGGHASWALHSATAYTPIDALKSVQAGSHPGVRDGVPHLAQGGTRRHSGHVAIQRHVHRVGVFACQWRPCFQFVVCGRHVVEPRRHADAACSIHVGVDAVMGDDGGAARATHDIMTKRIGPPLTAMRMMAPRRGVLRRLFARRDRVARTLWRSKAVRHAVWRFRMRRCGNGAACIHAKSLRMFGGGGGCMDVWTRYAKFWRCTHVTFQSVRHGARHTYYVAFARMWWRTGRPWRHCLSPQ